MVVQDAVMEFDSQITLDHDEKVTKLYIDDAFEMDLMTEPLYYANKEKRTLPQDFCTKF